MFLGEKFKLDTPTLGLAANRRRQVLVPAKSIIEIVSVPTDYQQMVDVLWEGQPLTMFVLDVDLLGTEVAEPERLNLKQAVKRKPAVFAHFEGFFVNEWGEMFRTKICGSPK